MEEPQSSTSQFVASYTFNPALLGLEVQLVPYQEPQGDLLQLAPVERQSHQPSTSKQQPPGHPLNHPEGNSAQPKITPNDQSLPKAESSFELKCLICGDNGTGTHYGALSCDGCKGFFRRSVSGIQKYHCRFERNCSITKEARNKCRFCRLRKCFKVGMNKDNVQQEREGCRRRYERNPKRNTLKELNLQTLIEIENQCQAEADAASNLEIKINADSSTKKMANIADVYESLNKQVAYLIVWTKKISCISRVAHGDQAILLKSFFGELLLLELIRRSINLRDTICLANGSVIPVYGTSNQTSDTDVKSVQEEMQKFASEIMRSVIQPLKKAYADNTELICLKALVFLNPNVNGLSNSGHLDTLRHNLQMKLEDYSNERHVELKARFVKLLVSLRRLHLVAQNFVHQIRLHRMSMVNSFTQDAEELFFGSPTDGDFEKILEEFWKYLENIFLGC